MEAVQGTFSESGQLKLMVKAMKKEGNKDSRTGLASAVLGDTAVKQGMVKYLMKSHCSEVWR